MKCHLHRLGRFDLTNTTSWCVLPDAASEMFFMEDSPAVQLFPDLSVSLFVGLDEWSRAVRKTPSSRITPAESDSYRTISVCISPSGFLTYE